MFPKYIYAHHTLVQCGIHWFDQFIVGMLLQKNDKFVKIPTWYPIASNPLTTNSKSVRKFSTLGLVTTMLVKPNPIAPATARPIAADLPRPRAAVIEQVVFCREAFSVAASSKRSSTFDWHNVAHLFSNGPMGFVSAKERWSFCSSNCASDFTPYKLIKK